MRKARLEMANPFQLHAAGGRPDSHRWYSARFVEFMYESVWVSVHVRLRARVCVCVRV